MFQDTKYVSDAYLLPNAVSFKNCYSIKQWQDKRQWEVTRVSLYYSTPKSEKTVELRGGVDAQKGVDLALHPFLASLSPIATETRQTFPRQADFTGSLKS